VMTVHDLTPVRYPELANHFTLAFPEMIRRALGRGAWVHTPSEFVRAEVVDVFGAEPDRVVAIHHGAGTDRVEPGNPGRGRALAGSNRFVLAVGTVEPRKDLPTLVRAFDIVARDDPDLRLVLAGADGWGAEALTAAVGAARHRTRIARLGRVDDRARVDLLAAAAVYAFPSLYEGFGLPPVEAMGAGVPVVASRAGALPEVCRDGADLVEPGDPDGLAAALARILGDEAHRATLVERGRRVAAGYDWTRASDRLAELFQAAHATAR
jgi:glycosyltransferase involved in cell wall biosynthesis